MENTANVKVRLHSTWPAPGPVQSDEIWEHSEWPPSPNNSLQPSHHTQPFVKVETQHIKRWPFINNTADMVPAMTTLTSRVCSVCSPSLEWLPRLIYPSSNCNANLPRHSLSPCCNEPHLPPGNLSDTLVVINCDSVVPTASINDTVFWTQHTFKTRFWTWYI